MLKFLQQNMGTIVVLSILLFVLYLAIRKMIKDKKEGKSCCGGNCSSCAGCANYSSYNK